MLLRLPPVASPKVGKRTRHAFGKYSGVGLLSAAQRGLIRMVSRDEEDVAVVTGEIDRRYGFDVSTEVMPGSMRGRRARRFRRRSIDRPVIVALLVAALMTGLTSAGTAASGGDSTGVTAKEIKLGFISSETGVAGSVFHNAVKAFQARVDRQNAHGGVHGRKIVTETIDDGGAVNNLQAVQELVQVRKVFAVVNDSSFAFLGYRYLLENDVPMVGGGYDGNEYGQPGNEDLISLFGNAGPQPGAAYFSPGSSLKQLGATKIAALGYAVSPSSVAATKSFQKYTVPAMGLEAVYTNTAVDFGTTDVGPLVLGMKNAGADGVFLPLQSSTNFAILTAAAQSGLQFKVALLATGYGQDLLDQPIAKQLGPEVLFAQGWAPVELETKATKQFQADLKKYRAVHGRARLRAVHRLPHRRPRHRRTRGRGRTTHTDAASSPAQRRWARGTPPAWVASPSTSARRTSANLPPPNVGGVCESKTASSCRFRRTASRPSAS